MVDMRRVNVPARSVTITVEQWLVATIRRAVDSFERHAKAIAEADPTNYDVMFPEEDANTLRALADSIEAGGVDTCTWRQDDPFEGGPWMTSCGNAFEIIEGTPHDNDMKFCPYCGLYLTEAPSSN